ncbi:hypothetical protein DRO69_00405 [Candidatus Bathyarchaeota archaeon]|mgnify:CR=1 FL=1|nr:MAG: hypothetical protein DRO69_00405 [Candidatus Bathyarchaeota archaeon]
MRYVRAVVWVGLLALAIIVGAYFGAPCPSSDVEFVDDALPLRFIVVYFFENEAVVPVPNARVLIYLNGVLREALITDENGEAVTQLCYMSGTKLKVEVLTEKVNQTFDIIVPQNLLIKEYRTFWPTTEHLAYDYYGFTLPLKIEEKGEEL